MDFSPVLIILKSNVFTYLEVVDVGVDQSSNSTKLLLLGNKSDRS